MTEPPPGSPPEHRDPAGGPGPHSEASGLRVLMLAPTPFFSDRGCHVRILEEARALARRGAQVTVCTYFLGDDPPGLDVRRTGALPGYGKRSAGPAWGKLLLDAALWRLARRAVRELRPHVVHAHLHEGIGVAAFLPRHPGTIRILDVQGGLTEETLDHRFLPDLPPVRGLLQGVEGWLDRRADAVITSHADVARVMVNQFRVQPEKIHQVGDAAGDFPEPAAPAVEEHRHRLGLRPGEPVLLYAGLLGEHQGTPHLFEVAEALDRRGGPGRVLALGYPEARWVAEARRRGLGDRLLFPGRFAYGDFAALLALGTVALSPKVSRTEGNQKVYAYLRAGLPVVAFDTPATRDILGEAGILVETGDGGRFAAEALALLEDPAAREALAARSRARASRLGGWDAVAGRVLEAYRSAGLRFPPLD